MPKTGRPLSTKTLALRTLNDAKAGNATRWAALMAARPYLTIEEYGTELRKLAATARAKVLRLCLLRLAELERDPGDAELEEQLGALVGKPTIAGAPKSTPSSSVPLPPPEPQPAPASVPQTEASKVMDERVRHLLSDPRPVPPKPDRAEVASAAQSSETGRKPSQPPRTKPRWWLPDSPAKEDESLVSNIAARRQRETGDVFALETAGVSFAALQSSALAAERERREKPKNRYYQMATCGDALNGET